MSEFIRYKVRFEDQNVVENTEIDCEAEKFTSISIEVIGSTPIKINDRPWDNTKGIFTVEVEIPNYNLTKYNIQFLNETDKRVIVTTSRVVGSETVKVNQIICK